VPARVKPAAFVAAAGASILSAHDCDHMLAGRPGPCSRCSNRSHICFIMPSDARAAKHPIGGQTRAAHLRLSASKDAAVVFDRPMLEVAEDLGLTHEAYYRALATLAHAGAIKRMGRTIRLISSATRKSNRELEPGVRT
jgi:hypothetical protein